MSNFLQVCQIMVLIFSLLVATMPVTLAQEASGETTEASTETYPVESNEGLYNVLNQGLNVGIQALQMKQQLSSNMRQALLPFQVQPAIPDIFPNQCRVSPAIPNKVYNICQFDGRLAQALSIANPYQRNEQVNYLNQEVENYLQVANRTIDVWDQYLEEGKHHNSGPIVGWECLKKENQNFQQQLDNKIKELTSMRNQLDFAGANLDAYVTAQEKILKDYSQVLQGSNGGQLSPNSHAILNRLMGPYRTPCNNVLDTDNVFGKKGLNGIIERMQQPSDGQNKSLKELAEIAIRDQDIWTKNLQTQIERVTQLLSEEGIEGMQGKLYRISEGSTKFGPIANNTMLGNRINELQAEHQELTSDLKSKLQYDLPALNRYFNENTSTFLKDASYTFRNKYLRECITDANSPLSFFTIDNISSAHHLNAGLNGGTSVYNYINEMQTILKNYAKSDDKQNFDDYLANIRQKENALGKGEIVISLQNRLAGCESVVANSNRRTYSVYEIYLCMQNKCSAKYEAEEAPQVADYSRRLKKYQDKVKAFAGQVAQDLNDAVINCGGSDLKSGSCGGSENYLTESANFCIPQALSCARDVRNCYEGADKAITTAKDEKRAQAMLTNQQVTNFVNEVNNNLNQVANKVKTDLALLSQAFFGSTDANKGEAAVNDALKNLLVLPPQIPKNSDTTEEAFDAGLVEPRDAKTYLDAYKEKMDQLIAALRAKGASIDELVEKEIEQEVKNTMRNKEMWQEQVLKPCNEMKEKIKAQVAAKNAADKEAFDKTQKALGEFCKQYQSYRAPGCDDSSDQQSAQELYRDSTEVMAYLNPSVRKNLKEEVKAYEKMCAGSSNEAVPADVEKDKSFADLCARSKNNFEEVLDDYESAIRKAVTDSNQKKEVNEFLADEDSNTLPKNLPEGVSSALSQLKKLRSAKVDEDPVKIDKKIFVALQNNSNINGKNCSDATVFHQTKQAQCKLFQETLTKLANSDDIKIEDVKKLIDNSKDDLFTTGSTTRSAITQFKILDAFENKYKFGKKGEGLCSQYFNQQLIAHLNNHCTDSAAVECTDSNKFEEKAKEESVGDMNLDRSIRVMVNTLNDESFGKGRKTRIGEQKDFFDAPCAATNQTQTSNIMGGLDSFDNATIKEGRTNAKNYFEQ